MSFDDDILRSRIRSAGGATPGEAHLALAELKPAMKRARLRRQVAVGAMTAALVGVGGVGVVALKAGNQPLTVQTSAPSDDGDPVPPPSTLADDQAPPSSGTMRSRDDEPFTDSRAGTSGEPAVESTDDDVPDLSIDDDPGPSVTNAPAPTTTKPRAAAPAPTTTPSTTRPPTTTTVTSTNAAPATSGEETISSNCGVVIVSYSGSSVQLVDAQARAGFAVDVKNAGPEEVEVGFADEVDECEVKARMVSGELTTSVDNHDS